MIKWSKKNKQENEIACLETVGGIDYINGTVFDGPVNKLFILCFIIGKCRGRSSSTKKKKTVVAINTVQAIQLLRNVHVNISFTKES